MAGNLKAIHIPRALGGGRIAYLPEREDARLTAAQLFDTRLYANHYSRRGQLLDAVDLGSGLVTNVGVLALANDGFWSATNALNNLFSHLKYVATGTGSTAAAATDIKLQTPSTQGGQTPVGTNAPTLVSAANLQKFQLVQTISYTGGEAVTEWGIFAYDSTLPSTSNLSDATGSPFTSGTATTGVTTGTTLTASSGTVMGQQMSIFEYTAGGLGWGLVTSNTTSTVTVPAWYKVSDGTTATAPANTNPYVIRPIMWDHKVFSAINVISGDSIQFTYQLTINSGG